MLVWELVRAFEWAGFPLRVGSDESGNAIAKRTAVRISSLRKETAGTPRQKFFGRTVLLFLLLGAAVFAAEYQGQNVDGPRYWGFARSLETGNYYPASVVIDRDHASVRFESGKRLDLTLEEQDPEEVLASDPHGRWALSVDGLDEPVERPERLMIAEGRK
jgi:hypothetical protein